MVLFYEKFRLSLNISFAQSNLNINSKIFSFTFECLIFLSR